MHLLYYIITININIYFDFGFWGLLLKIFEKYKLWNNNNHALSFNS